MHEWSSSEEVVSHVVIYELSSKEGTKGRVIKSLFHFIESEGAWYNSFLQWNNLNRGRLMRNSLFPLRMRPVYTWRELMERLNYSRKIKRRSKLKKERPQRWEQFKRCILYGRRRRRRVVLNLCVLFREIGVE